MDAAIFAYDFEGASIADEWSVRGTRVSLETGFYFQNRDGWLRPYAGFGGGFSISRRRVNDQPTRFGRLTSSAHIAAGIDLLMGASWSLRMDARARRMVGLPKSYDLTVGFSRRIGRG
jgi:hypothetical protein